MKYLALLLFVVMLVCLPYTIEFALVDASALPWQAFSQTLPDVTGVHQGSCGGEPILSATLERDGKRYAYFAAESGRFLFAEMNSDGRPLRVWVGQSLPSPDHDKITVLDEHSYSEDRDGAGPCGHLFPKQA